MGNGVRIRGLSGAVSSVSVQSTIAETWAMIGRKWLGLARRVHDLDIDKDELVVIKCQSGSCVLELEALGGDCGDTIVRQDVSSVRLRRHQRQRVTLRESGAPVSLTTVRIRHPWERRGAIIET